MDYLQKILGYSSRNKDAVSTPAPEATPTAQRTIMIEREIGMPKVAGRNFLNLFMSVPEVFFPIDFIASRIAKATFEVKRAKDDSVVWNHNAMLKILARPNCLMSFSELVYAHFVYKLATGNGYIRAAMADEFRDSKKYKMCSNFWPLPAPDVKAVPASHEVPLFDVCDIDELIGYYKLATTNQREKRIPTYQIWHDRDGKPEYFAGCYLKSQSRLLSVMKPISNLIAVYEARNVIYVKRGGIGFLVNIREDVTGHTALDPDEVKELQDTLNKTYGIGEGQTPIGFTNTPLSFIRTNLSIAELQPFEETLEDAVKIAGAYGIPDVLVPRKDHSTFNNQSTAEKSAYCGVIIPMAKRFCNDLTTFLGLDQDGYYLDCNFSDVDCLQDGLKEAEQVKKLINDRCRQQFLDGLISLNDWRAQIHESQIEEEVDPIFSKLKFAMTPEELARVERIIKDKNTNTNPKPSTGDEQHQSGNEEEPRVSNEGE